MGESPREFEPRRYHGPETFYELEWIAAAHAFIYKKQQYVELQLYHVG